MQSALMHSGCSISCTSSASRQPGAPLLLPARSFANSRHCNPAGPSRKQQQSLDCRWQLNAATMVQSSNLDIDLPQGYVWYETMIVLRPDLSEEDRDVELAKFEAFLKKENSQEISALVRGNQRLAYPIKGFWDGIYVLYTYAAQRRTSQAVQKLLSTPVVGKEKNVLRHMTFITN
ncbi:g10886 [Coccomyxa viridis]|uniref:G10886 protein n=1 Tax=Coccomyxa viridis TaxID=1274662 RepID=A0ABP1GB12_9CHLO